jgi:hypothetical protein
MKYLKFIQVKFISDIGDYFQSNYSYIISDSLSDISDQLKINPKIIKVRISGRQDASFRGLYPHWDLEKALFKIAKEYIIEKIKLGVELKDVEESYGDLLSYVDIENANLENFNTTINLIEYSE